MTLPDFLRSELGLTGTHLGCEHGVCGACTILLDGRSARSCLMLAVQADGHEITTIEGIAPAPDKLHPLQEAFRDNHGQQCGSCTPGMLATLLELLRDNPEPTEQEVRWRSPASLPLYRISRHRVGGARRRQAPEGAGLAAGHSDHFEELHRRQRVLANSHIEWREAFSTAEISAAAAE
jgi:aerobic-type carbon monoxide dehydrogenase small subunit (CoxS/CutS family)